MVSILFPAAVVPAFPIARDAQVSDKAGMLFRRIRTSPVFGLRGKSIRCKRTNIPSMTANGHIETLGDYYSDIHALCEEMVFIDVLSCYLLL
jgi:hypothetical protein